MQSLLMSDVGFPYQNFPGWLVFGSIIILISSSSYGPSTAITLLDLSSANMVPMWSSSGRVLPPWMLKRAPSLFPMHAQKLKTSQNRGEYVAILYSG